MTSNNSILGTEVPRNVIDNLIHLLWGTKINDDIFQRWNQGFIFGTDEPTALLQYDGGPCAVIVPVQAFFLKNLLFTTPVLPDNWRQTAGPLRDAMLCAALSDILCHSLPLIGGSLSLVICSQSEVATAASNVSPDVTQSLPAANAGKPQLPDAAVTMTADEFHASLRRVTCGTRTELVSFLQQHLSTLSSQHGVLLFLYSLLLTKGLDQIKAEKADGDEPLIDPVHGHGSQSLINLLLTGLAVPHVWDNEKDVSGLKLQGITSRSEIGFLTLLEHLRYCEVGWFLKNPRYPIWLLGSETHLTVLFSEDRTLVGEENQESLVRRIFGRFDEEGRGFINTESLGSLMNQLDLVAVPEYVTIMSEKLDSEQLGIITFETFVDEFYPGVFSHNSDGSDRPFTVYHYNGLQRSATNKVMYARGTCTVPDMPELQMMSDFSPIKTCLLTKWPTIELRWDNNVIPSMN